MPAGWKHLRIESSNFGAIRDCALDENKIRWSQIRLQIYKGFNGSERQ